MAIIDIKVPQMGEGLTEVRVLEFLKSPGDGVRRDELLYTMETDKATLEVESPEAGTLKEWLAAEGEVLPIGAPIARIDTSAAQAVQAPEPEGGADTAAASQRPPAARPERVIPPRTRAYARELGIGDDDLARIPSVTAKLMPADIDAYRGVKPGPDASAMSQRSTEVDFEDSPLPERQRTLNYHMRRSAQVVIPGTISRPVEWAALRAHVAAMRVQPDYGRLTEFQAFAFCVVQAAAACPKMFCSLVKEDTVRRYRRLNLGAAVALPGGELATAVLPRADLLAYPDFVSRLHERIQLARAGTDQADATVQLVLSYLGSHGIRDAVPVLVAPSSAVLFLGEPYTSEGRLQANVALTFDHRLMNGVEAAQLLAAVAERLAQAETLANP
jgi:pyruvate/2-oxoglutarate dehydrogenase complex dihydrolipoamide acyltransferase (E2) component